MKLILQRTDQTDRRTYGELRHEDGAFICHTLELPWRNNESGKSCIPAREYECRRDWHHPLAANRYKVWEYQNVPGGRTDVQIHVANRVDQIRGCVATGSGRSHQKELDDAGYVLASQVAFDALEKATAGLDVLTVEVRNPQPPNSNA